MHSEDASPSIRTLFVGYLVNGRVPDAWDYKACQSPHSEMVGRISLARDSNPGPFDPESDALTVRPLAILAVQYYLCRRIQNTAPLHPLSLPISQHAVL